MKNGNGRVVLYLVGVIVTLVLFIGFPTLINYVIANDQDSRTRDSVLDVKIQMVQKETNKHLSDIKDCLTKFVREQSIATTAMQKDIQYLRKNGRQLN